MDCIVKMPDGTEDGSLAMTFVDSDVFYRTNRDDTLSSIILTEFI
jgi:hypothetical protein